MTEAQLLSIAEAARVLGIHFTTAYDWIAASGGVELVPGVPVIRMGLGQRMRVSRPLLGRYVGLSVAS